VTLHRIPERTDTVVREGLKALINAQPDMEVSGEAADGAACRAARDQAPDVVIMDVSMPGLGGAKATELLRQSRPAVKVLALTVHEEKSYLRQLLQAGASGYVLKRVAADELIQAIRVVAGGGTYLDPSLVGKVLSAFVRGPLPGSVESAGVLSEREEEVLRLVVKGYTNKEIAARFDLSVKPVESYKARSMEKLDLDSRAAIISYASRRGWLSEN
jgi:DNA-binding NarL/FixJ family response regulator